MIPTFSRNSNLNHSSLVKSKAPFARGVSPAVATELPHLIFTIAEQFYACPIDAFDKVVRRDDLQIVPAIAGRDKPWDAGLTEIAGKIIPLISLRALWGFAPLPEQRENALRESVLLFTPKNFSCGLLVDGCNGVVKTLSENSSRLAIPAALHQSRRHFFEHACRWREQLLVTVRLNELITTEIHEHLHCIYETQVSTKR